MSGGPVQATLFDRGNGLIYDDVLNITWLKDVKYARTSGQDSDGVFFWADAVAWADQLVYGGHNDWRLPKVTPVSGTTLNLFFSRDGSTDYGYNISYPGRISPPDPPSVSAGFTGNELAHMFFVNLGNLAAWTVDGTWRGTALVDWGLINASFVDGDTGETVTFENLLGAIGFWTSFGPAHVSNAFAFLYSGFNDSANKLHFFEAWAVRDGDVVPVVDPDPDPNAVHEPGTPVLLLLGLLASLAFRRRIQRRPA